MRLLEDIRQRYKIGLALLDQLGDWVSGVARLDLGQSYSTAGRWRGSIERARRTAPRNDRARGGDPHRSAARRAHRRSSARPSGCARLAAFDRARRLSADRWRPALLLLAATTGWLSTSPGSLVVLTLASPCRWPLPRGSSRRPRPSRSRPRTSRRPRRGVPRARLIWVHAARQSLRPVLGVYGIDAPPSADRSRNSIGWPGIGRLMSTRSSAAICILRPGAARGRGPDRVGQHGR